MSNNLLDNYNPLYDANLRHYFTSPHMQRHLRSIGLLDSNGVPVATDGNVESEVYSRHYVMMDMLLRNRETQLVQLADLQRKLDAAEKVESYRRVRSGNGSPVSGRRVHVSRSLSRPRGLLSRRLRRHSNQPAEGDVIKRVEQEYDNETPPIRNIYDRLSQRATKYRYLHKLDDKTLTSYKDSLQSQLNKLERFRDVSFGPYSVARQQGPQTNSWFFRRRSLPSLTSSAPANSLHQPLRSINSLRGRARNGASQSPRKLNGNHISRNAHPARAAADKSKLPPLPKRPVGLPPKPKSKTPSLTKADSKEKLPTLAVVGVPVAVAAGAAVLGATALLNGDGARSEENKDDDSGSMIDYGAEQTLNGHAEEEHLRERREAVPEDEEPETSPVAYEISADELIGNHVEDERPEENEAEEHEAVAFEISAGPEAEPEYAHDSQTPEPVAFEVNADELKADHDDAEENAEIEPKTATEPPKMSESDALGPEDHEHEVVPEAVAFEVNADELRAEPEHAEMPDHHEHEPREASPVAYEISADELIENHVEDDRPEVEEHESVAFEISADDLKAEPEAEREFVHDSHTPEPVAFEVGADELTEQTTSHEERHEHAEEPFEVNGNELHAQADHSEVPASIAFEVDADELKEDPVEHHEEPSQEHDDEPVAFEVSADELKHDSEAAEGQEPVQFDLSYTPERPLSVDTVQEERVQKIVEDSLQAASEATPEPKDTEEEAEPNHSGSPTPDTVVHNSFENGLRESVHSPVAFEVNADELHDHHEANEPEPIAFEISADELKEEEGRETPKEENNVEDMDPDSFEISADELHEESINRVTPEPANLIERDAPSENDYIKHDDDEDDDEQEVSSYEVHSDERINLREEPKLDEAHSLLLPGEGHPTINLIEPSICRDSTYQYESSMPEHPRYSITTARERVAPRSRWRPRT